MELDFRNCKTVDDVKKVFRGHKKEFDVLKKVI